MKTIIALFAATLLLAPTAQAGQGLSCQVKQEARQARLKTKAAPKVIEFLWSTAHCCEESTGPVKTSIGSFDLAPGPGYSMLLTFS